MTTGQNLMPTLVNLFDGLSKEVNVIVCSVSGSVEGGNRAYVSKYD